MLEVVWHVPVVMSLGNISNPDFRGVLKTLFKSLDG